MSDPLEDLVLNGGADARRTAAELPGIEHSRRGPGDDKRNDDVDDDDDDDAGNDGEEVGHSAPFTDGATAAGRDRDVMPRSQAESYNTGPKGVISDQKYSATAKAHAESERIRATNAAMQRMALTANTVDEEDALRRKELRAAERRPEEEKERGTPAAQGDDRVDPVAAAEFAARERRRAQRIEELQREAERKRALLLGTGIGTVSELPPQRVDVWFGHLREVDAIGYVRATEEERDDVPVVVHIYEKSVAACRMLTSALASLARQYPHTKFVQVRALSVGFGLSDEDLNAAEEDDEEDDPVQFHARQEALLSRVEPILPTLHIYRGGSLHANLVRVDLEDDWQGGKETAVRDILLHHRAISDVREKGRKSKPSGRDGDSDSDYDV